MRIQKASIGLHVKKTHTLKENMYMKVMAILPFTSRMKVVLVEDAVS